MNTASLCSLLLATSLIAGCSGSESTAPESSGGTGGSVGGLGGSGGGSNVTLTGSVGGAGVPAGSKVMVIWSVSSGNGDHAAKFGEGTIDGPSFSVTFPGAPPTEALNVWGEGHVGVGFVIAVPSDFKLADGIVQMSVLELESNVIAGNFRQMILWRSGSVQDPAWARSFPDGTFACGQCVDENGIFDSIAPLSCEELSLWPEAEAQCNWS